MKTYLDSNPGMADLLRYYGMGLKHTEIGRLLLVSPSTVRDRLKVLADLGLADYRPSEQLACAGRLGNAAMRQKKAFEALQLSLPMEG